MSVHKWGLVVEIPFWTGACVGVWLLTLSAVTWPDLVVAAACGVPCALLAQAGRRAVQGAWRPRLRWLTWLGPLAAAIPADLARLFALASLPAVAGHPSPAGRDQAGAVGRFREIAMPGGEPVHVANARHALAILTISATPGSFVIGSDPEGAALAIHELGSGWPHLDQVVAR